MKGTILFMTDLEKMSKQSSDRETMKRELEIQLAHGALEIDACPEVLYAGDKRAPCTHTHE